MRKFTKRAFTLIELLIVVAIIAILAAIAVPNFLEAQVRAKVSRAKNDMRTMATGLEAYAADNNGYPDIFTRMSRITTPISYLSTVPKDVFRIQQGGGSGFAGQQRYYRYGATALNINDFQSHPSRWALASNGPDTDIDVYFGGVADNDNNANSDAQYVADNNALRLYPGYSDELFGGGATVNSQVFRYVNYDPTNGSVSDGDVFRLSDHAMQ